MLAIAIPAHTAWPRQDSLLGKQAPEFVRKDLNNQRVDLAGLRGRVVLLNFWATWCAPCQIEMPRFIAWQSQYKKEGLEILGVSMDDDLDPVQAWVRRQSVNYPVIMGDEKLGLSYGGILGLPVTFLIDRKGVIRARFRGETDLNAMESSMKKLLGGR